MAEIYHEYFRAWLMGPEKEAEDDRGGAETDKSGTVSALHIQWAYTRREH